MVLIISSQLLMPHQGKLVQPHAGGENVKQVRTGQLGIKGSIPGKSSLSHQCRCSSSSLHRPSPPPPPPPTKGHSVGAGQALRERVVYPTSQKGQGRAQSE